MQHSTFRLGVIVGALVCIAGVCGCTLKKQEAPPLTGPSELSTAITLTATPDTIPQDGAAQSVIVINARDAGNQPISNLSLHIDMVACNPSCNLASDFGTFSTRNPTTGADGRASVVYTAPAWPETGFQPDIMVRIYASPVGSNFDNANYHYVSIRLIEPTILYAPGTPYPQFTFSPSVPAVAQQVFFDASASKDSDGTIVNYQWTYGDGDVEYGEVQQHDFPAAGTYYVTLTVTDNDGKKASTTRGITVVAK
jgi:PKD domain